MRDSDIVRDSGVWRVTVNRIIVLAILTGVALWFAPAAFAQMGPEEAGSEWQVWTSGGHGINGSTMDTGVWNLGLRYGIILTKPRKIKPYYQIEGGTLFTNTKVPEGTSQINFTTSAAVGMFVLGKKHNWTAEVRFQHISNAGINTVQMRIGWGMFRK